MRLIIIILLLSTPLLTHAQSKAEIIKLPRLQEIISAKSDKIKVINFWATWCAPCIKEMPLFEELHKTREDVEVILVSMDLDLDPDPAKVYRFIDRKKLQARVVILDERDPNSFIDKIDKNWSGALPVTIIVNGKTGQRKSVEKELHEGDLEKLIDDVK